MEQGELVETGGLVWGASGRSLGYVWAMEFVGWGQLWGSWRAAGGLVNLRDRLQRVGPRGPSRTVPGRNARLRAQGDKRKQWPLSGRGKGPLLG